MKTITKLILLLSLAFMITGAYAQDKKDWKKDITTQSKNVVEKSTEGISTVYGDGKSLIQTIHGDGKEAVKYLTPKVVSLIETVAKKLETTSDKLWLILVRQQLVMSWTYLILFLFAVCASLNFYHRYTKYSDMNHNERGWAWSHIIICVLSGTAALVLILVSAPNLPAMMTGFINPEYGAAVDIYQFAKSLK
jgi:hypothetical protein